MYQKFTWSTLSDPLLSFLLVGAKHQAVLSVISCLGKILLSCDNCDMHFICLKNGILLGLCPPSISLYIIGLFELLVD